MGLGACIVSERQASASSHLASILESPDASYITLGTSANRLSQSPLPGTHSPLVAYSGVGLERTRGLPTASRSASPLHHK